MLTLNQLFGTFTERNYAYIKCVPLNVEPAMTDGTAAACELPGNELVTAQNITVTC
jgi:hypothetical protein